MRTVCRSCKVDKECTSTTWSPYTRYRGDSRCSCVLHSIREDFIRMIRVEVRLSEEMYPIILQALSAALNLFQGSVLEHFQY